MAKIIYNGRGIIQGVPARDLTQEEFDALPKGTQELAIDSGVYEIVNDKPKKEAVKDGDK
jgi:hypothetical protein